MQDVEDGTFPHVLLFGIISLAARFSNDVYFTGIDRRVRGRPFAQEAEHLLNLRDVSLITIQAAVLIGAFVITEGEAAAEAIYYAIACRCAMLLDLPNMIVPSRVEQEVNRRAWWTLKMIDVWSSNGVRLAPALQLRADVPYPMEETIFLQLRREDFDLPSPGSMQESYASLLTQMIKLNAILVEIQKLNQAAAASTSLAGFGLNEQVDTLTEKLESWYNSLPVSLQDTHANLARYCKLNMSIPTNAVHNLY